MTRQLTLLKYLSSLTAILMGLGEQGYQIESNIWCKFKFDVGRAKCIFYSLANCLRSKLERIKYSSAYLCTL